jgi:hypothetical protein
MFSELIPRYVSETNVRFGILSLGGKHWLSFIVHGAFVDNTIAEDVACRTATMKSSFMIAVVCGAHTTEAIVPIQPSRITHRLHWM